MARSIYPDEVWEAIRTLWEGVPKITWAEVLRQVGEITDSEVPSQQACINRQKKEKWKKKRLKSDLKNSLKNQDGNQASSDEEKELNTISYADFIKHKFCEKIQAEKDENPLPKNRVKELLDSTFAEAENEQSKIVRQHRRQAEYLAELYQTLLSQADDLFALQLDIDDENFDEVSFKHAKLATLTEKKTNIALMLAQVGKLTQERVFKAWGITEVEDDRRVKARQQDIEAQEEELATSRAAMRSEQEKLCRERMAMVERGYFIERVEGEAD